MCRDMQLISLMCCDQLVLPGYLLPLLPISRMIDFLNAASSNRDFASVPLSWVVLVTIDEAI